MNIRWPEAIANQGLWERTQRDPIRIQHYYGALVAYVTDEPLAYSARLAGGISGNGVGLTLWGQLRAS